MINGYESLDSLIHTNPRIVDWSKLSAEPLSEGFVRRHGDKLDWDILLERNFYSPYIILSNIFRIRNWYNISSRYATIFTISDLKILEHYLIWPEVFLRRVFNEDDIKELINFVPDIWRLISYSGRFSEDFFWDNIEKFGDQEISNMANNRSIEDWFGEGKRSAKLDVFLKLR